MTASLEIRDFTAAEIAQIADDYAIAKAAADEAEKRLNELKKLVDATGRSELIGNTFRLDVSIFERKTFDASAAKAFLTEDQIALCTKVGDVRRIAVKAAVKLHVVA
jgi:hypothetical protein